MAKDPKQPVTTAQPWQTVDAEPAKPADTTTETAAEVKPAEVAQPAPTETAIAKTISTGGIAETRANGPLVKVKKLNANAALPQYATDGSACFDIVGLNVEKSINSHENSVIYSTGLAFEIPEDHVMLMFSRSGHGFNDNVRLSNCVGVIDADYRGELKVKLTRDNNVSSIGITRGARVAQALVLPVAQVEFLEVEELSSTVRGENGLGSTGQ